MVDIKHNALLSSKFYQFLLSSEFQSTVLHLKLYPNLFLWSVFVFGFEGREESFKSAVMTTRSLANTLKPPPALSTSAYLTSEERQKHNDFLVSKAGDEVSFISVFTILLTKEAFRKEPNYISQISSIEAIIGVRP